MSIRFIHAADLHIDSPMKNLKESDVETGTRASESTRLAFAELTRVAMEREVAFLIVAGDIFDGAWDSVETRNWTLARFHELNDAGIDVYIVYGNHDKKNPILRDRRLQFPPRVKVFSDSSPETFVKEYYDSHSGTSVLAALHGQSYPNEKCPENLAEGYPQRVPNAFNIGVLHTDLSGKGSNYAPVDLGTLNSKEYQYWALGHQHARETIQEKPSWIGYSGVLQARHINEINPEGCGCYLVEIEDENTIGSHQFIPCDQLRWRREAFDLSEVETEEELKELVIERVGAILDSPELYFKPDGAEKRFVVARLVFEGRTKLYNWIKEVDVNALRDYLESWLSLYRGFAIEKIEWRVHSKREESEYIGGSIAMIREIFEKRVKRLEDLSERINAGEADPVELQRYADVKKLSELRKKFSDSRVDLKTDDDDSIDFNSPDLYVRWYKEAEEILINEICNRAKE